MRNARGSRHSLANTQKLTIIAQDPSVKIGGKILVAEVDVPAEGLLAGPPGFRVNVWNDVSEQDAIGLFAPFKVERFRDEIVAQEIVARCVIAQGPHSLAAFLFAAFSRDTLIGPWRT